MGRAAAVRAVTKAKTDGRKAKINAIFGKRIIMAVKNGGGSGDMEANTMLRDCVKQAKANSVPVDNIQRAIKRATEGLSGDFVESTFEACKSNLNALMVMVLSRAYIFISSLKDGFGGASFIINVLSDNANRATSDVKSTVNKRQAKIAEQGSVLFMYDRKGKCEVSALLDEETLLEAAIEYGCEDMELVPGDEEGTSFVFSDPKQTGMMADAIRSLGHENVKTSLVYVSKAPVEVSEEDYLKNMEVIDALEELDDVDSVDHNMI
jgi:transcriptional/translational regulatory protein YebC/TACO1